MKKNATKINNEKWYANPVCILFNFLEKLFIDKNNPRGPKVSKKPLSCDLYVKLFYLKILSRTFKNNNRIKLQIC